MPQNMTDFSWDKDAFASRRYLRVPCEHIRVATLTQPLPSWKGAECHRRELQLGENLTAKSLLQPS